MKIQENLDLHNQDGEQNDCGAIEEDFANKIKQVSRQWEEGSTEKKVNENMLEGVEKDITYARVINLCTKS